MNRAAALLVAGVAFCVSAYADVYGSPLVQHTDYTGTDYCTGCVLTYIPLSPIGLGQTLTSWAFYASANPSFPQHGPTGTGNLITPLLLHDNGGGTFQVVGVGTTRASTGPGIQSYSFGIVSGTDIIAAGDWFGWRDGGTTAGSGNNGTISLSLNSGPGINYSGYPLGDQKALVLGGTYFSNFAAARTYSVQVITPEPGFYSTMFTLALGLTGLVTVRRLRTA